MNRKFFDRAASREDAGTKAVSRPKPSGVESTPVVRDPSATGAWDPYEVWLTRVKQPRDRRGAFGTS